VVTNINPKRHPFGTDSNRLPLSLWPPLTNYPFFFPYQCENSFPPTGDDSPPMPSVRLPLHGLLHFFSFLPQTPLRKVVLNVDFYPTAIQKSHGSLRHLASAPIGDVTDHIGFNFHSLLIGELLPPPAVFSFCGIDGESLFGLFTHMPELGWLAGPGGSQPLWP